MPIRQGLIETIGQTPLIRIASLSEATGCEILGKAEFLNPGGSIKDRAAKYMLLDAFERGELEAGGVVVEGTAGNTGIGLTLVGRALGVRSVIVMPRTQSQEKKDLLRLYGAELVEVDAVPFTNPENYVHQARRRAEALASREAHGVLYANQWDNPSNREGHIRSTGPEIWEQTGGQIDGFAAAVGTGGTLAGVSAYLKQKNPQVVTAVADPEGSKICSYFTRGELEGSGNSISEGIGQGRVTGNLEGAPVDTGFTLPDHEALPLLFQVMEEDGLCLGGSSAINLAGAVRLAKQLGPGKTIVTVLCDGGLRYRSKLWNPEFLRQKDLPIPNWLEAQS